MCDAFVLLLRVRGQASYARNLHGMSKMSQSSPAKIIPLQSARRPTGEQDSGRFVSIVLAPIRGCFSYRGMCGVEGLHPSPERQSLPADMIPLQ